MIEKVYRDACDITSALYEATTVVPELFGEEAAARALDDFDIRYGALMRHLAARSKTARDYA
ncbi:hypothetical protein [Henriciella sp.]|uniref:hypothetical protein n=1 Tax=Henriciella sp. TaxID=1968823 RepID=UPI0026353F2F|nr:hypothetical protein [Henriciella sp.]